MTTLQQAFAPQLDPSTFYKGQPVVMVFFMDVTNAIEKTPEEGGSIEIGKFAIDLSLPVEDQLNSFEAEWELVAHKDSPIETKLPVLKKRV